MWSVAMDRALYGAAGLYVTGPGASGHFRTSASPSVREIFAGAVAQLLDRVDAALGRPAQFDLVDVGAGSAALLESVLGLLRTDVRGRVRPIVVERRRAPATLPPRVIWRATVPEMTGLLIANEWLDNVPIDVVEDGVAGAAVLVVDDTGAELPGPPPSPQEAAWLARWWPSGPRRELGLRRDEAWSEAVSRLVRGVAVAIDYTHVAGQRPPYGTLTGFRAGRETTPIPDGSCDVTAHVAIDSVLAAGAGAGAAHGRVVRTLLTDQRTALRALGVTGRRPAYAADPGGYAAALQRTSDAAELIDATGLGGFSWLMQGIDLDPAAVLPLVSSLPRP